MNHTILKYYNASFVNKWMVLPTIFIKFLWMLFFPVDCCFAETVKNSKINQADDDLGSIVVTATRLEEPIENIPASITVVSKEDIAKKHPITIDELLRDVPGMHISRFGTIGEESFPRLRGTDERHLLVMIDGVVINPSFDDVFDFADYHVDNIERIEIVRGNYSALYGSDAIGGVINIITKKPEAKSKYFISSEGGSFYTARETIGINNNINSLKFVITGARTDSAGNYERDEYQNLTFSLNSQYDITKDSQLKFIARYIRSTKEIPVAITANISPPIIPRVIFDQNARTRRSTFINSLSFEKYVSSTWDFNITTSYYNFHKIVDDEGQEGANLMAFFQSDTISRRYTLETQQNFYIHRLDTLIAGVAVEREEADHSSNTNFTLGGLFPDHVAFDKYRTNYGVYLQNTFNWNDRLVFIAGGRYDYYSTFGSVFNPKFSASYLLEPTQTRFKASYSHGYHAPSFDQLYSTPLGNKKLKEEKSKSFEIGFDQYIKKDFLQLGLVYFQIDYRNRIIRDLAAFQYVNTGVARSNGFEAYLKIKPIDNLSFKVNYTLNDTENKDTGEPLSSIPKYMLNFNVDYQPTEPLNLNMDVNFVGSEFASAGNIIGLDGNPLGETNPGYYKVDLSASYVFSSDWNSLKDLTLYGTILNLFNEEYTEVAGAPSPGINFLAGVRATF